MDKKEEVVLVTGCSSGFGRLSVESLARKGYRVFASMRESAGRNAGARDQLAELARRERLFLKVIELDVTDERSVNGAVDGVIAEAGRIDVLVNNAGFAYWSLTEAFSVEQAQRIFDTNFFGVVRMNRAVLPHMRRRQRGLLVHVSSGAGRGVLPGMGLYTATKFALEALAETYRYELSQLGVESIIIEPGPFATEIFAKHEAPRDQSRVAEYGPLADLPAQTHAALTTSAADAHEVADLLVRLIEMPAGQRPFRTLLGPVVDSLQPLNDLSAQLQQGILTSLGMGHLLSVRQVEGR
jgi:NAD(P)-dependent dehydrogenase (short-subunit alcohol dehydrogenase family)